MDKFCHIHLVIMILILRNFEIISIANRWFCDKIRKESNSYNNDILSNKITWIYSYAFFHEFAVWDNYKNNLEILSIIYVQQIKTET